MTYAMSETSKDDNIAGTSGAAFNKYIYGKHILQILDQKSITNLQMWVIAPLVQTGPTNISYWDILHRYDDTKTENNAREWFNHSNC